MLPFRYRADPLGVPKRKRRRVPFASGESGVEGFDMSGAKKFGNDLDNTKNSLGVALTKVYTFFKHIETAVDTPGKTIERANKRLAGLIVHAFSPDPKDVRSDSFVILKELEAFEMLLAAIFMYKNLSYVMFYHKAKALILPSTEAAAEDRAAPAPGQAGGSLLSSAMNSARSAAANVASSAVASTASNAVAKPIPLKNMVEGLAAAISPPPAAASPSQTPATAPPASVAQLATHLSRPAVSSLPSPVAPPAVAPAPTEAVAPAPTEASAEPIVAAAPMAGLSGLMGLAKNIAGPALTAIGASSADAATPNLNSISSITESLSNPEKMAAFLENVPGPVREMVTDVIGGGPPKSTLSDIVHFTKSVGGFFASPGIKINNSIYGALSEPVPASIIAYSPWPSVLALLLMGLCLAICLYAGDIFRSVYNVAMGQSGLTGYLLGTLALGVFVAESVKKYTHPVQMALLYMFGGIYKLLFVLICKGALAFMFWPQITAILVLSYSVYLSSSVVFRERLNTFQALREVADYINGNDGIVTEYGSVKFFFDKFASRIPPIAFAGRFIHGLTNITKLKTTGLSFTITSIYSLGLVGTTYACL